jgi:signal transduction histidine kinase
VLAETVAPLEMAQRGFHEANSTFLRLNETLEEHVATRTRELQDEIVEAIRLTEQQRRNLLSRLISVQEDERRSIASDIHDDSIQLMVAAGIRLGMLREELEEPKQIKALETLEESVRLAVARLRKLIFELRPPTLDREGLVAALRLYLQEQEGGPELVLDSRLTAEPPAQTRVTAYRIAQEALTNARKHAGARKVEVRLEALDGGLAVCVRDDGSGFPPEEVLPLQPGHLGLTAMRERAELAGGWCRVDSAPGEGTTVDFWLPW